MSTITISLEKNHIDQQNKSLRRKIIPLGFQRKCSSVLLCHNLSKI